MARILYEEDEPAQRMIIGPVSRVVVVAVLVTCSCAHRAVRPEAPPQTTPEQVLQGLAQLRSFSFRLWYRAGEPLELQADFRGVWQSPSRELWVGYWRRGGVVTDIRMVGDDIVQYEQQIRRRACPLYANGDDGEWRRSPRGVETQILEQLKSTLEGRKLLYIGSTGGQHAFTFSTVVPLLDPMRQRQLRGLLLLGRRTGLLESVRCDDDSGTTLWEVSFSRFNRAVDIEVPFVAVSCLLIEPEVSVAMWDGWRMSSCLQGRFKLLGWRYRMYRKGCRRYRVCFDRDVPRSLAQLVFGRGVVELWAVQPVDSASLGDSVKCIAGDVANQVSLQRLLGRNRSLQVRLDSSVQIDPALVVRCPAGDSIARMVVLLVDGECIGVARCREDGSARFGNIGREDQLRVLAAITSTDPLPTRCRIVEYGHR